mmetsp:Transcript_13811/g.22879  ORF Transcript_13811/g.22879 Transcript_13811/m.22879 type:complete len:332 (+) Transcript_13811:251-1246(+)
MPVSPVDDRPSEKNKVTTPTAANRAELPSSVLELGQRARQRLEAERSKRREIVVLTQPLPVPPTRQPKAAASSRAASSAPAQPHPITIAKAQKEKSSILRVEGLPAHCTPDMIRRFFSGFNPDRIVVLPTLDLEITEWGESVAPNERVLVKFPSGPIAVAASQRSYEYILYGDEKFVIKLSLVTKLTGNYLLQNLSIDGIAGESLTKTRKNTESKTQPCIIHFLWTMAIRELQLDAEEWMEDSSYPWKQCVGDFYDNLSGLEAYRESLSQELDRMERSGAILQLHAGDPKVLLFDAVVRFYDTARKRLQKEITAATNLIIMARYETQRIST